MALRWNVSPWKTLCNQVRAGNEIKAINTWGLSVPKGRGLKAAEPLQMFSLYPSHALAGHWLGPGICFFPSLTAVIYFLFILGVRVCGRGDVWAFLSF